MAKATRRRRLEMYDGSSPASTTPYIDSVGDRSARARVREPMICARHDSTHPDVAPANSLTTVKISMVEVAAGSARGGRLTGLSARGTRVAREPGVACGRGHRECPAGRPRDGSSSGVGDEVGRQQRIPASRNRPRGSCSRRSDVGVVEAGEEGRRYISRPVGVELTSPSRSSRRRTIDRFRRRIAVDVTLREGGHRSACVTLLRFARLPQKRETLPTLCEASRKRVTWVGIHRQLVHQIPEPPSVGTAPGVSRSTPASRNR